MAAQGFLNFFVIAVIVGSVIGMPRDLLIQAGPRFVVPLVGCLTLTFAVIGLLGMVTGFGGLQAILFIAAPIMAGGLGVGAVPMSEMYAERLGGSSADFMGDLMSAVAVANIFCILITGGYNALGKLKEQPFSGFNGYGQLLRISKKGKDLTIPKRPNYGMLSALGKGLAITAVLYVLGQYLGDALPFLHAYAWTIIVALVLNLSNRFPKELTEAATGWGDYKSYLVPALLVGVSLTYIDIGEVLDALQNPVFIPLTIVTVMLATLTSGAIGWLVKMNFIESAITPGLVMADTGGSGDVAVLSAANNRMHLMPFAALTNRVGGVLVLFVTSVLAGFL